MGFWGSLGKGLLKVAPIAAAFIPGVGPLASMAISAGTNALAKKASGGSWKSALGAGALGAATGLAGGSIGPSGSMLSKITGGIGKMTGSGATGWQGALSNVVRGGINTLQGQGQQPQQQMTQMPQQPQLPMADMGEPLISSRRRQGIAPSGLGNAFRQGASQVQAYS